MDAIVQQVSEKTGLSEEQSRMVVTMVAGWIQNQLPENIQPLVAGFIGGNAAPSGGAADALTGMLGGMLGDS